MSKVMVWDTVGACDSRHYHGCPVSEWGKGTVVDYYFDGKKIWTIVCRDQAAAEKQIAVLKERNEVSAAEYVARGLEVPTHYLLWDYKIR